MCLLEWVAEEFLPSVCRYLQERFSQLQEEVNLLKSNIMKYKVLTHTQSNTQHQQHCKSILQVSSFSFIWSCFLFPQTALEKRKNSYSRPSSSSPLTGVLSAKQGEQHNLFALNQRQVTNTFCCACLQHTDPLLSLSNLKILCRQTMDPASGKTNHGLHLQHAVLFNNWFFPPSLLLSSTTETLPDTSWVTNCLVSAGEQWLVVRKWTLCRDWQPPPDAAQWALLLTLGERHLWGSSHCFSTPLPSLALCCI